MREPVPRVVIAPAVIHFLPGGILSDASDESVRREAVKRRNMFRLKCMDNLVKRYSMSKWSFLDHPALRVFHAVHHHKCIGINFFNFGVYFA